MKSRWFLALAAIITLALFSSLALPVAAETPTVELVLGGAGATPWAIGNIAPGNSGTNTVTLSNTGYKDGVVTIWISDIVNSEGANPEPETGDTAEPGELGDYLILNVSGTNLSTDFALPAKIHHFPQSAADNKHAYVNPLKALSTLNLRWEWLLPPETGNNVQGDRLSFTINYVLEESPPLPSPPPPPPGGEGSSDATISVGITKTGPSSVFVGFAESYTMTVTNTGAVALNDVTVTDELPEGLSHQSSIPSGTAIGNEVIWNLGTLAIGETKEIVSILSGEKAGAVVSTGTVTTREGVSASTPLDITVGSFPPVLLAPSGIQKVMSAWLIPAVMGAAALILYIVFIMVRRRVRWNWIPYVLPAGAVNVSGQTAKQRMLYARNQKMRVAELAGAIDREMNRSKKLAGDDILRTARILAVANAVETMADTVKTTSSPGHYRPAMGSTSYDSEVVKAFGRLVDRHRFGFHTRYN